MATSGPNTTTVTNILYSELNSLIQFILNRKTAIHNKIEKGVTINDCSIDRE